MKNGRVTCGQERGSIKTPYAVFQGELFVQIRATGIPTLCFNTDGITIHRFPKDRYNYIKLAAAIEWHEKELAFTKRPQRMLKALGILKDARDRLEAELRAQAGAEHADGGLEMA